jgi:hypothetical protein
LRTKTAFTLVAVTGLALLFSGCFGFMGIKFSNTNLKPNPPKQSKTVAKVWSQPVLTKAQKEAGFFPGRDYPFFLIGADESLKFLAGAARFDVPGRFGPKGGRPLVRDTDLEAAIASAEFFCGDPDDLPPNFRVFRTETRVNDRGKVRASTFSKLPFKQTELAYPYSPPGVTIRTGGWFDYDGDGVVDPFDDDAYGCTGGGYFNLNLKDDPDATPLRAGWKRGS